MPVLSAEDVDELPILKADALKFLTLLRGQLPTPALLGAFGSLIRLLAADSNVVHSYAAVAIERLLASKVCQIRPQTTTCGAEAAQLWPQLFMWCSHGLWLLHVACPGSPTSSVTCASTSMPGGHSC